MAQSYCRWPALIKNDVGGRTGTPTELQKQKKQRGLPPELPNWNPKAQQHDFSNRIFISRDHEVASKSISEKWATAEQNGDCRNSIPASGISRKAQKNHETGGSHEGPWPSDVDIVVKDLYWARQPSYAARRKSQDLLGPLFNVNKGWLVGYENYLG